MAKVYYITHGDSPTEDDQIIPSPELTIGTRIDYASETNNVIVGHNHIITLTGVVTAYRRTDPDNLTQAIILDRVVDGISKLRSTFSLMGGTLYVKSDDGLTDLIVAIGGKLVSFEVTESDNNWKSFANYTVQIEFQSVSYTGDNEACLSTLLSASTTPNAVDNSIYKIKEYSEDYTIELGENSYNRIRVLDSTQDASIENMYFDFTYSVSATGKHFFVNNQLMPAWEQAKNFCQLKLWGKIRWLAFNLGITGSQACSATRTLQNMQNVPASEGVLSDLYPEYEIFNEQVSSTISESDGTFSAVYKCIIKRVNNLSNDQVIHTFSKNIIYNKNDTISTKIVVSGTIQGLILGGLVYNTNGFFNMPSVSNGYLIVTGNGSINAKYTNAMNALVNYVIGDDFTTSFKDKLDITYEGLHLSNSYYDCSIPGNRPKPSSFTLTSNPFDGTITYVAEFTSNKNCQSEYSNITINVNKPTTVFATFVIPGAQGTSGIGTILQDLGTKTAQTIDITIQGRRDADKRCCYTSDNITNILSSVCTNITMPASLAANLPDPSIYILKTKNKTTNFMDGSYTINLGYICNPGCNI